jgi:hypothetical protein
MKFLVTLALLAFTLPAAAEEAPTAVQKVERVGKTAKEVKNDLKKVEAATDGLTGKKPARKRARTRSR